MKAAVSVRIPGKVMLCGEYSVLTGGRALSATLDRHLVVRIRKKAGLGGANIASDIWDSPRFVAQNAAPTGEPLLDAVTRGMQLFDVQNIELRIDSELDLKFGFGSSSALRLGVLLGLDEMARAAHGEPLVRPRHELHKMAKEAYLLQKKAQSQASGYDVATQLVGGLIEFEKGDDDQSWPKCAAHCEPRLQQSLPHLVHLYGGGTGAPTTALVTSTLGWLDQENLLPTLAEANEGLRLAFLAALKSPEDKSLMRDLTSAVRTQRQLFAASPRYPLHLAQVLEAIPGCDEQWSFKTTGAGGEDALLLIGWTADLTQATSALKQLGWQRIAVGFETAGARVTRGGAPYV